MVQLSQYITLILLDILYITIYIIEPVWLFLQRIEILISVVIRLICVS